MSRHTQILADAAHKVYLAHLPLQERVKAAIEAEKKVHASWDYRLPEKYRT